MTNPVESYNSQLRRITKTKGSFPNDTVLEKLVYLKLKALQSRWDKKTIPNWPEVLATLKIQFGDRMENK